MSSTIPEEALRLKQQFIEEEEAIAQKRRLAKSASPEKNSVEVRRIMKPSEIEHLAKQRGITVEGGGGKHGKHLVAPNGRRCSLPDHGAKDLATGTCRVIISFIFQNGISRN